MFGDGVWEVRLMIAIRWLRRKGLVRGVGRGIGRWTSLGKYI